MNQVTKAYADSKVKGVLWLGSSLTPITGNMRVRDVPVDELFKTGDSTKIFKMGPFFSTAIDTINPSEDSTARAAQDLMTGDAVIFPANDWVNRFTPQPEQDIDLIPYIT